MACEGLKPLRKSWPNAGVPSPSLLLLIVQLCRYEILVEHAGRLVFTVQTNRLPYGKAPETQKEEWKLFTNGDGRRWSRPAISRGIIHICAASNITYWRGYTSLEIMVLPLSAWIPCYLRARAGGTFTSSG